MERRIIFLREKHCDRAWHADTEEDLENSAKAIIRERIEHGGYYFDKDLEEARQSLVSTRKRAAWNFLQYRSSGEYEYATLMHVEPFAENKAV